MKNLNQNFCILNLDLIFKLLIRAIFRLMLGVVRVPNLHHISLNFAIPMSFRFISFYFISPCRCQQQCVNTIGSYKCECFPGFRFNDNDQCIDIDECKMVNFRCPNSAQCINTAGSYKCICSDGFKLSRDKTECIEIKNECKSLTVKYGQARCTRSR